MLFEDSERKAKMEWIENEQKHNNSETDSARVTHYLK